MLKERLKSSELTCSSSALYPGSLRRPEWRHLAEQVLQPEGLSSVRVTKSVCESRDRTVTNTQKGAQRNSGHFWNLVTQGPGRRTNKNLKHDQQCHQEKLPQVPVYTCWLRPNWAKPSHIVSWSRRGTVHLVQNRREYILLVAYTRFKVKFLLCV